MTVVSSWPTMVNSEYGSTEAIGEGGEKAIQTIKTVGFRENGNTDATLGKRFIKDG